MSTDTDTQQSDELDAPPAAAETIDYPVRRGVLPPGVTLTVTQTGYEAKAGPLSDDRELAATAAEPAAPTEEADT